jgi:transposase
VRVARADLEQAPLLTLGRAAKRHGLRYEHLRRWIRAGERGAGTLWASLGGRACRYLSVAQAAAMAEALTRRRSLRFQERVLRGLQRWQEAQAVRVEREVLDALLRAIPPARRWSNPQARRQATVLRLSLEWLRLTLELRRYGVNIVELFQQSRPPNP